MRPVLENRWYFCWKFFKKKMRCVCLLICVCTCAACFFPERNLPKELSERVSMGSCEAQVFISLNDLPHGGNLMERQQLWRFFFKFWTQPSSFVFIFYLFTLGAAPRACRNSPGRDHTRATVAAWATAGTMPDPSPASPPGRPRPKEGEVGGRRAAGFVVCLCPWSFSSTLGTPSAPSPPTVC